MKLELKSPELNIIIQPIHWIHLSKVPWNKANLLFFLLYIFEKKIFSKASIILTL